MHEEERRTLKRRRKPHRHLGYFTNEEEHSAQLPCVHMAPRRRTGSAWVLPLRHPPPTLTSFSRNTLGVSSIHSLQNLPREYPGPHGCRTGCPPGSRQPTGLAALCSVGDLGAHRTWWQDHMASGRAHLLCLPREVTPAAVSPERSRPGLLKPGFAQDHERHLSTSQAPEPASEDSHSTWL